jgi:hypothetical protein
MIGAMWALWLGCAGDGGLAERQAIVSAVADWRANPDDSHVRAVAKACEAGEAVASPDAALELVLGDALSNVVLRPDLGVPHLERAFPSKPTDAERDAWLDALLRHGEINRFNGEYHRLLGGDAPLGAQHKSARALVSQAARSPAFHWQEYVQASHAVRLAEDAQGLPRRSVDAYIDGYVQLAEAAVILLEGYTLEVVTTRSSVTTDEDVLLTPGEWPAYEGKRRIVAYAAGLAGPDVVAPARAIDALRTPKLSTLSIRAFSPGGAELRIHAEGKWRDGTYWIFGSGDKLRFQYWYEASLLMLDLRQRGVPEADVRRQVAETWRTKFLEAEKQWWAEQAVKVPAD